MKPPCFMADFGFASHWPEFNMCTFTKIMSNRGNIKDTMKALTE